MAIKLQDSLTLSGGTLTTGAKAPNTLTKWPEGGGTVTVRAVGSQAGSPVIVQLRAWNESSAKEVLATITLPVPATDDNGNPNPNAGNLYDSVPVFSIWHNFDYNVTQVGVNTTQLVFSVTGVGV